MSMNLIFQSKDINVRLDFFFFFDQGPTIYCLQETHFRVKDTQTEGEGMEKRCFIHIEITRKQG